MLTLAGTRQRLLAQQTAVAQQDMQRAQLRLDAARSENDALAVRDELAMVLAGRVQLTRLEFCAC